MRDTKSRMRQVTEQAAVHSVAGVALAPSGVGRSGSNAFRYGMGAATVTWTISWRSIATVPDERGDAR
jgi:hypothetical protein